MASPSPTLLISVIFLFCHLPISSSSPPHSLTQRSSLSVEEQKDDILISPNGRFTAGFHSVGKNAYCFAIWFSEPVTVVWMANRDVPVNGKLSKLSLLKSGDLILTDAGQSIVWTTRTESNSPSNLQLQLKNNGNLVLVNDEGEIIWQSFDSPTDTLLPYQPITGDAPLVSSRSPTNFSSGFYKLYFDNDNVLRLIFNGPGITSVFWPDPWLNPWEAGRSPYNNSRKARLDSSGRFKSSDDFDFRTGDFGVGPQRRLTLDSDGSFRVYSLHFETKTWKVSWQHNSEPCKIHGVCGQNSLCTYNHTVGRKCSCLPGYMTKNNTDWSYGCEPKFNTSCLDGGGTTDDFVETAQTEFYGSDMGFFDNYTLDECKRACLQYCTCKGIQFKFFSDKGYYSCYIKFLLVNGYQKGFKDSMYIRLPKRLQLSYSQKPDQESSLFCPTQMKTTLLDRNYKSKQKNGSLEFMLWFTCAFGAFELICIAFFWYYTRQPSGTKDQRYLQVATGFKRFTYDELKKASRNFSEEIGRGGSGIVYKGKLSDNRVAAIKRLGQGVNNDQGEAEFLAEISIVGKINHMNLIETWGYCVERKHRFLVFEYIENGSLSESLSSNKLDWKKRYEIAIGTAKGLAYLHEECLEWVLHCDVKPHNILLDDNYEPKVADFGLSKILNRRGNDDSNFSRIRGTRGYMAPEWVFNLPITSKVDVYSYGVVMLEMVTGRKPTSEECDGGGEQIRLVNWVREKMNGDEIRTQVEEISDPRLNGEYDADTMINVIKVALQCVEEDRDARPTMSQVVLMLLHPEDA